MDFANLRDAIAPRPIPVAIECSLSPAEVHARIDQETKSVKPWNRFYSSRFRLAGQVALRPNTQRVLSVWSAQVRGFYDPKLFATIEATPSGGSLVSGAIQFPGNRYVVAATTICSIVLIAGLSAGIAGLITGNPVRSSDGESVFPILVIIPLTTLAGVGFLHLLFSRQAMVIQEKIRHRLDEVLAVNAGRQDYG